MVVRDAFCDPYGAHLSLAGADNLELPDLALVGYGKALAFVDIAVLFGKCAHQLDCLPRA